MRFRWWVCIRRLHRAWISQCRWMVDCDKVGTGWRFSFREFILYHVRSLFDANSPRLREGFSLSLVSGFTFAPSQRRLIAIRLSQCNPCYEDTLKFAIQLTAENEKGTTTVLSIPVVVKFRHHRVWWSEEGAAIAPIRATCMYASTQPTSFLVIPPILPNQNMPRVPILALRECRTVSCERRAS